MSKEDKYATVKCLLDSRGNTTTKDCQFIGKNFFGEGSRMGHILSGSKIVTMIIDKSIIDAGNAIIKLIKDKSIIKGSGGGNKCKMRNFLCRLKDYFLDKKPSKSGQDNRIKFNNKFHQQVASKLDDTNKKKLLYILVYTYIYANYKKNDTHKNFERMLHPNCKNRLVLPDTLDGYYDNNKPKHARNSVCIKYWLLLSFFDTLLDVIKDQDVVNDTSVYNNIYTNIYEIVRYEREVVSIDKHGEFIKKILDYSSDAGWFEKLTQKLESIKLVDNLDGNTSVTEYIFTGGKLNKTKKIRRIINSKKSKKFKKSKKSKKLKKFKKSKKLYRTMSHKH